MNCFDRCIEAWNFHPQASFPDDWAWVHAIFVLGSLGYQGPDVSPDAPREALRRLEVAGVDWKCLEKIKAKLHLIENKFARA